jgi:hypothetical protein
MLCQISELFLWGHPGPGDLLQKMPETPELKQVISV